MESISLPTAQGWSTPGCQSAMARRQGRGSRGLMCSQILQFTGLSTAGIRRGELHAPAAPTQMLGPVSCKMAGKDEGHELHGIF